MLQLSDTELVLHSTDNVLHENFASSYQVIYGKGVAYGSFSGSDLKFSGELGFIPFLDGMSMQSESFEWVTIESSQSGNVGSVFFQSVTGSHAFSTGTCGPGNWEYSLQKVGRSDTEVYVQISNGGGVVAELDVSSDGFILRLS